MGSYGELRAVFLIAFADLYIETFLMSFSA